MGADAAAPLDAHGGGGQDHVAADVQAADAPAGDTTVPIDARSDVAPIEGGSDAGPVDPYSLQFDGISTYVDCGDVPVPADFTIEAWVNPATYDNETYVVAEDRDYQPQGQFRFGFVGTGQLFFVMTDSQSNLYGLQANTAAPYNLISPSALPTNTWSDVAVAKAGGSFTLLVNGVVVSTVTTTSFAFGNGGAQNAMRVGARLAQDGTSANGVFDGLVDEVRFWGVGRTAAEITADMLQEINKSDPAWSSLQDYWPFDEGKGIKTGDLAGKFPGTLVNGPGWSTSTPF